MKRPLLISATVPRLFVAINLFLTFVTFLRLEGHGSDRPRVKAFKADSLAADLTITIFTPFNPRQRAIDFGDQFTLTIAGSEFNRPVGLR